MQIEGRHINKVLLIADRTNKVFEEDDVPYMGRVTIAKKYKELTGEELETRNAVISIDCGDIFFYLMASSAGNFLVEYNCDGSAIYSL